ncbi:MAG: YggT family protein [Fidelibacterota bacterium]|nr:MAG: YggT family protein [Candidatus Neomarinimicrobiota bacterium]
MYFLGNLLVALGQLIHFAVGILELLIIVQVVLSWLNISLPLNQLTRILYSITEAIYRPIRAIIPTMLGGLDFSPFIALAGLYIIDRWLISSIIRFGYQLSG